MNAHRSSPPELSRIIKIRALPHEPVKIEASPEERAALAERFGISRLESLVATVDLDRRGLKTRATGTLAADIVQPCAISGEDFDHRIEEEIALVFVPDSPVSSDGEIEIELDAEDLDEIEYTGDGFDLGEAIAQSLGLAIDPYAEGPDAESARKAAGLSRDDAPRGPLADALDALKKG